MQSSLNNTTPPPHDNVAEGRRHCYHAPRFFLCFLLKVIMYQVRIINGVGHCCHLLPRLQRPPLTRAPPPSPPTTSNARGCCPPRSSFILRVSRSCRAAASSTLSDSALSERRPSSDAREEWCCISCPQPEEWPWLLLWLGARREHEQRTQMEEGHMQLAYTHGRQYSCCAASVAMIVRLKKRQGVS